MKGAGVGVVVALASHVELVDVFVLDMGPYFQDGALEGVRGLLVGSLLLLLFTVFSASGLLKMILLMQRLLFPPWVLLLLPLWGLLLLLPLLMLPLLLLELRSSPSIPPTLRIRRLLWLLRRVRGGAVGGSSFHVFSCLSTA